MWSKRRVLLAILLVVGPTAAALGALLWAVRWQPPFYVDALEQAPTDARRGSDVTLHRATNLGNQMRKPCAWQATFTANDLNGWLATDLAESHAANLPAGVSAPRLAITPDQVVIAAQVRWAGLSAVAWIAVEPFLVEPSVLALRIRRLRAGHFPLPQKQLLAAIDEAARRANLRIHWRQTDGDPVAVITLPATADRKDHRVRLTGLRLEDGRITFSGATQKQ